MQKIGHRGPPICPERRPSLASTWHCYDSRTLRLLHPVGPQHDRSARPGADGNRSRRRLKRQFSLKPATISVFHEARLQIVRPRARFLKNTLVNCPGIAAGPNEGVSEHGDVATQIAVTPSFLGPNRSRRGAGCI